MAYLLVYVGGESENINLKIANRWSHSLCFKMNNLKTMLNNDQQLYND